MLPISSLIFEFIIKGEDIKSKINKKKMDFCIKYCDLPNRYDVRCFYYLDFGVKIFVVFIELHSQL